MNSTHINVGARTAAAAPSAAMARGGATSLMASMVVGHPAGVEGCPDRRRRAERHSRRTATGTDHPAVRGSTRQGRLYYIDWLKVLMVAGIFYYHCAMPFAYATWMISNR